jgi:hypothetical protein
MCYARSLAFLLLIEIAFGQKNITNAPGIINAILHSMFSLPVAVPQNRSWTINAISPDALRICYDAFFALAIAIGLFWVCFGYRYFRPVLYQAGFLYGLYCTMCVFASRLALGKEIV